MSARRIGEYVRKGKAFFDDVADRLRAPRKIAHELSALMAVARANEHARFLRAAGGQLNAKGLHYNAMELLGNATDVPRPFTAYVDGFRSSHAYRKSANTPTNKLTKLRFQHQPWKLGEQRQLPIFTARLVQVVQREQRLPEVAFVSRESCRHVRVADCLIRQRKQLTNKATRQLHVGTRAKDRW